MLFFKKKAYFGQNMLYNRNMLLIYQNMLLFFENTKICTYMSKISKKEHIYPISDYMIPLFCMFRSRRGDYITFLVIFSVKMLYFTKFSFFWPYFEYSKKDHFNNRILVP